MFLSVIIPAFNAQDTLARCMNSIQEALEHLDAEIIIINDGSQDQTREIAEDLADKSTRIIVINQDNSGVSSARNRGLFAASGRWICFVDDDDTITEDAFLRFSQTASDSDIAILRSFCEKKERYPWSNAFEAEKSYSKDDIMKKGYLRGSICGCILSRSFLEDNNIRFPEGIRLSEDTIFFGACLSKARKVCFFDIPFYQITPRPDSASRIRKADDLDALSNAIHAVPFHITDKAVRNYTTFKLIINYTSRAADSRVPSSVAYSNAHLADVIPISLEDIYTERTKIALLNLDYHLFYKLIAFRNRFR